MGYKLKLNRHGPRWTFLQRWAARITAKVLLKNGRDIEKATGAPAPLIAHWILLEAGYMVFGLPGYTKTGDRKHETKIQD